MHRRSFLRTLTTTSAGLALPAGAAKQTAAPAPKPAKAAVAFLTPEDAGYGAARKVFNSTILTRPPLIACCTTEAGVVQAVTRAAQDGRPMAIKSGGHSFEGFCLSEQGMTLELSGLKSLHLDSKSGILAAGPGCQLGEVNRWLLARGRLLPSGSCATVGLAGLTLGGGYGLFSRKYGLTCDHLESVRLVDASGAVHDSRDEPELLWACRGGGNGHFGVVTEMIFQTRTAPKQLAAFKCRAASLNEARATLLLKTWFEASATLPREAFSAFVLNGKFLTVLLTTTGPANHKGLLQFLKAMESLTGKSTSAKPVPLAAALPRYYGEPGPVAFKNASAGYYQSFADLQPAWPGVLHETLTTPGLIFQVNTLGGAIADGPESAYPHRAYPFLGEWQSYWQSPAQRDRCLAATTKVRKTLAKHGITRHYANYPDEGFADWPTAYYGAANYARLQALKKRIDPANRFRHAQSVRPD